jgi:hypothetical protein
MSCRNSDTDTGRQRGLGRHHAGELQQLVHHAIDDLDLLADPIARGASRRDRGAFLGGQIGGDADHVQRIPEVVHDGSREPLNQLESLGLEGFFEEAPVEIPHAQAGVGERSMRRAAANWRGAPEPC